MDYINYELMDPIKNIFKTPEKGPFTTAQLAKILNRPVRFCVDWTERGLFEADIQEATGPGSRRLFSYKAVLRAGLVLLLQKQFGINRSKLKEIVEPLSEWIFFETWETDKIDKLRVMDPHMKLPPQPPEGYNEMTLIIINISGHTKLFTFPFSLKYCLQQYNEYMLANYKTLSVNDIIGLDLKPLKQNIDSEIAKL